MARLEDPVVEEVYLNPRDRAPAALATPLVHHLVKAITEVTLTITFMVAGVAGLVQQEPGLVVDQMQVVQALKVV
jgi:hypothetical protein